MRRQRSFTILIGAMLVSGPASAQETITGSTAFGALGHKPLAATFEVSVEVRTPRRSDDRILYPHERGGIELSLVNVGDLSSGDLKIAVKVSEKARGLTVDSIPYIGRVEPGDSAHTIIGIRTGDNVSRRPVEVSLSLSDSLRSYGSYSTWLILDDRPEPEPTLFPTGGANWLFVIGINEYADWPDLVTPRTDATTLRELLVEQYTFDPNHILELYDRDATRRNIIRNLEYLAEKLNPKDNLLIYYAGHGTTDKGRARGFWVPSDGDIGSTAQYIPSTELQAFIAAIPTRATLVISDACFSGVVFREGDDPYIIRVATRKGRQALISGGNEPVMDSGVSASHSVFAYYLLDRLSQNREASLPVTSLFDLIKVPIANNSEQNPQCKPIQNTGDDGGEFVFVRRE